MNSLMSPIGEQPDLLHHISHDAVPAAPLREREAPGRSPGVAHDGLRRSASLLLSPSGSPEASMSDVCFQ